MEKEAKTILNDIKNLKRETDYWYISNGVLYDLCKKYPNHNNEAEIIAKVWLIGRSYAASIERNKNRKEKISDDFYVNTVAPKFKEGNIFDNCLSKIRTIEKITKESTPIILETHKKVTDFIKKITEDDKRSFVSKYLHFHFPALFFIYDSRVAGVINRVVSACGGSRKSYKGLLLKGNKKVDRIYADFFEKCFFLMQFCETKNIAITTREIDNYLIKMANVAKTRTTHSGFEPKFKK